MSSSSARRAGGSSYCHVWQYTIWRLSRRSSTDDPSPESSAARRTTSSHITTGSGAPPPRPPPRDARCAAPRRSGTARGGRRPASLLPLPVGLALLFECLRAFLGVLGLEDHRAQLALVLVRVAQAHAEPLPDALLRRLDRQRRVGGD